MKPSLTDVLKETINNNTKFKTLSIVLETQTKCAKEFVRLGISPQTMSFMILTLDKISEELDEAAKYAKINEDFNNITKGL
jgi:hypothetical protein